MKEICVSGGLASVSVPFLSSFLVLLFPAVFVAFPSQFPGRSSNFTARSSLFPPFFKFSSAGLDLDGDRFLDFDSSQFQDRFTFQLRLSHHFYFIYILHNNLYT